MASGRASLLPPFTEGDQGGYLNAIQEQLSSVKEDIQATIEDNMTLFMETLDQTTLLSQQVDRVSRELRRVRSRVSDPHVRPPFYYFKRIYDSFADIQSQNSLFSVVIDSARKRRALAEKERHSGVLTKILEALSETRRALSELDTSIQQRRVVLALHRRQTTQNLISALPGAYTPGNEPHIYATVKQEFNRLDQELLQLLQSSLSTALTFDQSTSSLVVRTTSGHHSTGSTNVQSTLLDDISHPMSLATTLAMLHQLGLAEDKIPQIVAKLTPFIDLFIVEPSSPTFSLPSLKIEPRGNNDTTLVVVESKSAAGGHLHAIVRGLASASTFFQFINDHLIAPFISESSRLESALQAANRESPNFGPASRLCPQLGAALLPIIIDKLVRCCFEYSIPEHRSQLEAYQASVSAEVDRFVPTLAKFQWLQSEPESYSLSTATLASPIATYEPHASSSLPSGGDGWKSISKFVDFLQNSHLQFAVKKRRTYLAKARELILSGVYTSRSVGEIEFGTLGEFDANSSASPGVETLFAAPLFKFPRCRVRDVVIQLVALAEDLVSDAFSDFEASTQQTASTLVVPDTPKFTGQYHIRNILLETAKDTLDLYRALVPSLEKNRISNIPSLSMLFHNDCHYIAHHATLLGAKCRLNLRFAPHEGPEDQFSASPSTSPSPVSGAAPAAPSTSKSSLRAATESVLPEPGAKPIFSFAELVPAFRSLAEQFYHDIVTAVRDHLRVLLDRMERLRNTDEEERKRKCLVSTRHIVSELESRDLMWGETLPAELHKVTMGRLLNEVVEWMIDSALQINDFTEPETESLNAIFTSLFPLARIFVNVQDPSTESSGANMSATSSKTDLGALTRESCAKYVKSWLKFEDLADSFNMRMVELVERFNAEDFHFSRPQTISIIKALFQDSAKRSEQIASLRTDIRR